MKHRDSPQQRIERNLAILKRSMDRLSSHFDVLHDVPEAGITLLQNLIAGHKRRRSSAEFQIYVWLFRVSAWSAVYEILRSRKTLARLKWQLQNDFGLELAPLFSQAETACDQLDNGVLRSRKNLATILDLRSTLTSEGDAIQTPPGWRLRKLAEFFYSPKVYQLVFEPTLRDLLDEYCQALHEKRLWKARWVRSRGYWSFWSAVFAQIPVSVAKRISQLWNLIRPI